MAHAEVCPVCKGSGKIVTYEEPGKTTTGGGMSQTCHGCMGTGWVTVQDPPYYIPIVPFNPFTLSPYTTGWTITCTYSQ